MLPRIEPEVDLVMTASTGLEKRRLDKFPDELVSPTASPLSRILFWRTAHSPPTWAAPSPIWRSSLADTIAAGVETPDLQIKDLLEGHKKPELPPYVMPTFPQAQAD